ncbi:MAG: hypothetical protein R3F17_10090 [Planctomycetota bacterium]
MAHLGLRPFAGDDLGRVDDVTQAQDGADAERAGAFKGRQQLAVHADRLVVDDHQVGALDFEGLQDKAAAQLDQGLEVEAQAARHIAAGGVFGHRRQLEHVHPGGQGETRGHRRASDDQRGAAGDALDQLAGQGDGAPEVPEAIGVVAVEQDAAGFLDLHGGTLVGV